MAAVEVHPFGVADRESFYQVWVVEDPQFNRLCMRNLNYRVFDGNWDSDLIPSATWLLSWGRLTAGNPTKRVPSGSALALSLGELLGPMLPVSLSLAQNDARLEFVSGVWSLIRHDNWGTVCDFEHIDFVRWVNSLTAENRTELIGLLTTAAQPAPNIQTPVVDAGTLPQGAGVQPAGRGTGAIPRAGVAQGEAQVGRGGAALAIIPDPTHIVRDRFTFEIAYYVLMHLASKALREARIDGVDILTNVYSAVMKRGSMSEKFKTKVEQGVYDDINIQTNLNIEACKIFSSRYGRFINAQNIRGVVAHWEALMPQRALRLRLIVQQASNSGLTALICIGTAMRLYPDFDWSLIARVMPVDIRNFQAAVLTVNGDPYYGFNQDLGNVKSTLYKNLTYPAKELLMKIGGKGSLSAYGGWPRIVPHQALIDRRIADYETDSAARIADANAGDLVIDHMASEALNPIKMLIEEHPALFTM